MAVMPKPAPNRGHLALARHAVGDRSSGGHDVTRSRAVQSARFQSRGKAARVPQTGPFQGVPMNDSIDTEQEEGGRWIAEVPEQGEARRNRHSCLCCRCMSRWPSSKGSLRYCELVGTSSAGPARIEPLHGRVDQTPCLHSVIEMRLARRCPLGQRRTRDLPRESYGAGVGRE